jgi:hypothetical protein
MEIGEGERRGEREEEGKGVEKREERYILFTDKTWH